MIREFRLSPPESRIGVSCDERGAFVGAIPLLKRRNTGGGQWEPRECTALCNELGEEFGLPIDVTSKLGGLKAIADALNDGDVARAQIATVLLGIPNPAALAKDVQPREARIRLIRDLDWSGMVKADWHAEEHPRWPAGTPESQGGQFAPKSGFWEDIMSVFSEVGRAEINQSNAEHAGAAEVGSAALRAFRDLAAYTAKPWIGSDGRAVQIPVINTGSEASDAGALIAHAILEPKAPLTRPGTNADWIDALISLGSAAAMAARPAGAKAPAEPEPAPPSIAKPFVTLRAKLAAGFDESVPIGKFEFPDHLIPGTKDHGDYAHDRIGNLLQEASGSNANLVLRTAPNTPGVDVEVPRPDIDDVGFEYAEIKPLSRAGRSRFNHQVLNVWDLEGQVQAITYDKDGNIYYGFPGL